MRKNIVLLLSIILCLSLALVACQKGEQNNTTIGVPLVGQQGDASKVDGTYPVGKQEYPVTEMEQTSQNQANVASMYPVKENNPNFDTDMEAWVKDLFGDKLDLESVLSQQKTEEEWRQFFSAPEFESLQLTEGPLGTLINWLMERAN